MIPQSISLKDFRSGNFKKEGPNRMDRRDHPVYLFLKKKQRACKVSMIAKAIKMKKNTVRSMLRSLIKDKLVEHKKPYFACKK